MFFSYFTEHPYTPFPDADALRHYEGDHPARVLGETSVLFSNRFFDPEVAQRLYGERIAEYQFAEEVGFDAVTLNEHHAVPWCLQARMNVLAAFVAAKTSRIRIFQTENVLPIWDNPVHLAEELAMVDLLSSGRLVCGIFRGPGQDMIANNVNPAHNRERFVEAHDLLIKAWTEPGPFRWEGTHYQFRVVNPWVLPLQKPHPRIIVYARSTAASINFAAEHGYPMLGINSTTEQNERVRSLYATTAERMGFVAGPEHRAYLVRVVAAETEREAHRLAQEFNALKNPEHNWGNPLWAYPTGYSTREEAASHRATKGPRYRSTTDQVRAGTLFAGTPDQVVEQMSGWLVANPASMLVIWGQDGGMSHAETIANLGMIGEHVLPELRKVGDELGLKSPFELGSPVGLPSMPASDLKH